MQDASFRWKLRSSTLEIIVLVTFSQKMSIFKIERNELKNDVLMQETIAPHVL
jgi:hypothetical protein